MKIKTRVLLYNSLMVPLSLIALLMIGSFVIGLWGRGSEFAADRGATKVTELLNAVEDREAAEELADDLASLGYTLYVFSPADRTLPFDADGALHGFASEEARTLNVSGSTYVIRAVSPYLLVAAGGGRVSGQPRSLKQLLITFLSVGGVSAAVIVALSYIFTSILLRHISRPLNALASGAQRVEDGDLSHPIDYPGDDEFKPVCDSFDHMQRHLQSEREKNAAYERARTDLVSGISHDLRTPLTSVKGYIKGIQDGIANTPEKVDRYLRTAYDKAGEMDVLLQRLFFFSNMETGNMMLSKKPLDLRDLTRYYVDEASLEPRMQQIVFETDFPTEPCVVSADAQMLRRVFNNLTENAVKYSEADPLHIHIALRNEGDACVITFRDNGRGVEEHQLRSLFDQFWRADSARQQEGGSSTGLGLYIVKYIIDSHGGSVTADNDGGLRMTIRLPRATVEQQ